MNNETQPGKHTLSGDGEAAQPEKKHILTNFALGIFRDNMDGHIFLGMLPVIDGVIRHDKPPYRFTGNTEETLVFFEKFKAELEGTKKRPAYLG